jgi:hypothetical protein
MLFQDKCEDRWITTGAMLSGCVHSQHIRAARSTQSQCHWRCAPGAAEPPYGEGSDCSNGEALPSKNEIPRFCEARNDIILLIKGSHGNNCEPFRRSTRKLDLLVASLIQQGQGKPCPNRFCGLLFPTCEISWLPGSMFCQNGYGSGARQCFAPIINSFHCRSEATFGRGCGG